MSKKTQKQIDQKDNLECK